MRHVCVWIRKAAREAEIRQLDLAVGGDQEVVGLDVTVQHEVRVAEIDRSTQHSHPGLDVGSAVGDGTVLDELFEITVGEVLDDHVDSLVLCGEDVEEADDGGVG